MLVIEDISNEIIYKIIDEALLFSKGKKVKTNDDIFVSNLFFENSTRTKTSFDIAQRRLGLNVVPFDISQSSINKGESLYDTVKTIRSLGVELAVIRHKKDKFFEDLKDIDISIINGGDGVSSHPSQTILDLTTIFQNFGRIEGLNIGIVGDIKHSRVAHSNSECMKRLGANVYYSGPKDLFDDTNEYRNFDELVKNVDVLMMLRIQHERHTSKSIISDNEYLENYGLTLRRENMMKPNSIIMHPGPVNRGVEIDTRLVECKRSKIFNQVENGVYARMAILKNVLENKGHIFYNK